MKILNTPTFNQINNKTVTASDTSFCLTPLVSVFELEHIGEAVGNYKMVIQACIPEGSANMKLDTSEFDRIIKVETPVGDLPARWIKVTYNQPKGIPEYFNVYSCELTLYVPDAEIDCVFYTHTVTNDKDDPKTRRGTVTTVRRTGSGQ
ncbi:hypothetical protein [uncultured Kordia sp.]|uniref:hypothetical protein n=1 Tax=uncultured Kordia sp. TaxID=507699 RepID=UPI00262780C8|nr:hypothetical protein [uncultured Kordia sp.]